MQIEGNGGPLSGLTVVDLTVMLSGPFTTMVLADLGARVIKVESREGDMVRAYAKFSENRDASSYGGYFQSINRNKESIGIDLKQPEGRKIFLDLVSGADILIENFRSGVMERLDLSWEFLHEHNPSLIYGAIRGFGDARTGQSPYESWPSFDVVAQAMGGVMGITGERGGPPTKIGAGIGDTVPSLFLAVGLLSALHHRKQTGKGQFVDVAMYDSVLAVCERIVYQHSYFGADPGREGSGHPLLCPFGLFRAADGYVAIGCPNEKFWGILVDTMGRPELATDPRYASNVLRSTNRSEVDSLVEEWTSTLTKAELMELLGGKIPLGPVNTATDVVNDPHVIARNMIATVQQPGPGGKAVQIANTPIRVLGSPTGVRTRAPLLGEQTDEILVSLGVDNQRLRELRAAGIIF